jgi:carbonyl reductase 1
VLLFKHFVKIIYNQRLAQTDQHKHICTSAYSMSKVGLTALTGLQQKAFDKDPREDIVVSALCPGYVDTDMSSHKGYLTPEQGSSLLHSLYIDN